MIILSFSFLLFFKQKKNSLFNQYFFNYIFIFMVNKNLSISGCLIYPISSLYIKNLLVVDIEKTIENISEA